VVGFSTEIDLVRSQLVSLRHDDSGRALFFRVTVTPTLGGCGISSRRPDGGAPGRSAQRAWGVRWCALRWPMKCPMRCSRLDGGTDIQARRPLSASRAARTRRPLMSLLSLPLPESKDKPHLFLGRTASALGAAQRWVSWRTARFKPEEVPASSRDPPQDVCSCIPYETVSPHRWRSSLNQAPTDASGVAIKG